MEYGTVTGVDKPVSRIVFGTDRLRGRRLRWLPDRRLERRAFSLLDRSFELGCNAFDTARVYRDSERTLGTWIGRHRNRDELVLISKGCHPGRLGRPRVSPSDISRDLHASLKALGTDWLDLYLLHYDDASARVGPLLERLNRHVDEGKIAAIGASNWSHRRIATANAFAADSGLVPFTASSVQFSLADWTRSPWPGAIAMGGDEQSAAREWYSTHRLSVFAYSSLGRGFFSDHFDPLNKSANQVSRWCANYFNSDENIGRLTRAKIFADEHDLTVAQVALSYVLCDPLQVFAVVGCATPDKIAQNAAALSISLDRATRQWLSTGQAL